MYFVIKSVPFLLQVSMKFSPQSSRKEKNREFYLPIIFENLIFYFFVLQSSALCGCVRHSNVLEEEAAIV